MTDGERRAGRGNARQIAWLRGQLVRLRKATPLLERLSGGSAQAVMSMVAAILAYVPTQWFGLKEGFWGAITALAVTQTEYDAVRSTARDQIVGAALGGLVALGALLIVPSHGMVRYGGVIIVAVLSCWLVNAATAARLSGITATIILIVPHQTSAERMFVSRLSEVAWGIAVAIAVVWCGTRVQALLAGEKRSDGMP